MRYFSVTGIVVLLLREVPAVSPLRIRRDISRRVHVRERSLFLDRVHGDEKSTARGRGSKEDTQRVESFASMREE
jgi:hypothetical protein